MRRHLSTTRQMFRRPVTGVTVPLCIALTLVLIGCSGSPPASTAPFTGTLTVSTRLADITATPKRC